MQQTVPCSSKHACIFSFFAGSQKKLANCDKGPGTEEIFLSYVSYYIKIECPLICSNPIARDFSYIKPTRLSAAE
jgi:hypothetical protein